MSSQLSTELGLAAENLAARWLQSKGFTILHRNWRTRWCELDIVTRKNDIIHFVEVKYRSRADFGHGFEYITSDKAQRLQRAAAMWLKATQHTTSQYQIDVIAITGSLEPKNVDYLPNAIEG